LISDVTLIGRKVHADRNSSRFCVQGRHFGPAVSLAPWSSCSGICRERHSPDRRSSSRWHCALRHSANFGARRDFARRLPWRRNRYPRPRRTALLLSRCFWLTGVARPLPARRSPPRSGFSAQLAARKKEYPPARARLRQKVPTPLETKRSQLRLVCWPAHRRRRHLVYFTPYRRGSQLRSLLLRFFDFASSCVFVSHAKRLPQVT